MSNKNTYKKSKFSEKLTSGPSLSNEDRCNSLVFDPFKHPNIKTCKCGREYNFVSFTKDGYKELPVCSFCADKNETCPVCEKPVTTLPWVSDNGRRVHSNNGLPGSLPCNAKLLFKRLTTSKE